MTFIHKNTLMFTKSNANGIKSVIEKLKHGAAQKSETGPNSKVSRAGLASFVRAIPLADPLTPARQVAGMTNFPRATVRRIIAEDPRMKQYGAVRSRKLNVTETLKRTDPCKKYLQMLESGEIHLAKIVWSDEKLLRRGGDSSGSGQDSRIIVSSDVKKNRGG